MIKGKEGDLLIVDDPYAAELVDSKELWNRLITRGFFVNPPYRGLGAPDLMSVSPEHLEELRKPRFGQRIKSWDLVGEVRRQKKAPHKEVTYVWTKDGQRPVMRSVNNCTNEQLIEAIRNVGSAIEQKYITQGDAEALLDSLYLELGRRANA